MGELLFNTARIPRRRILLGIAGVTLSAAAPIVYFAQAARRAQPAPFPDSFRPAPPIVDKRNSAEAYYWTGIEFNPDEKRFHFTRFPETVPFRLDSGDTILAQRVFGPSYKGVGHQIGTTLIDDIGHITIRVSDSKSVSGGEYMQQVDENGAVVTDDNGTAIRYPAHQGSIPTPTPEKPLS